MGEPSRGRSGPVRVASLSTSLVPEPERQALMQQLELTEKLLQTFFEWRHKVMVRFFVTVGGVLAAWAYSHSSKLPVWTTAAVAILGAAAALMSARLDAVNTYFLDFAYSKGREIESLLGIGDVGLYSGLAKPSGTRDGTCLCERSAKPIGTSPVPTRHADRPTYRRVLRWVYGSALVMFVALAAAAPWL